MQRRSVQRVDPRYKQLRTRNNDSVKKSREKSRREREETMKSIDQLEQDNTKLHKNLQTLKQEYDQLRDLFKQHTGIDIDQMLSNEIRTTSESATSSTQSREESKEISAKPVLTINTTDDTNSSSNQLDASSLDGSVVIINGVQYKIVSIEKN
ncbi:unnamed protein product [Rotaria magnacalcarata]|uniref:BZIP domain-containing protein n=1 Tax=Rotaria magnacalcarata TaxID=392030 RepID=A0A816NIQ1_9BILA|nr:unnamed protein product [Rotaria magnacalcarata]CAF1592299.1 unnamed protein product [Rotaria magnacalcarata]CAF2033516.1 unnamed protein product [Rotaria magnacalcarata]CAF2036088.1 unnamed protein product [Rotaria magnacalcarata]CAF2165315.1 unnamed protein product [Rotaria magnacalcarata]